MHQHFYGYLDVFSHLTIHVSDAYERLKSVLKYWVDAKVSADVFSFLCFKFLLKQNTINQQRIYHCYL